MSADVLPGFVDNLAMLRAAFELGEVDLTDVSVALEALLEARMQALDAHAAYLAAVAALEAAVGQEVWTETEVTR